MKSTLLLVLFWSPYASAQSNFDDFSTRLESMDPESRTAVYIQTAVDLSAWSLEDQGRFYHAWGLHKEMVIKDIQAAKATFTTSIELFEKHGQPNSHWVKSLLDRSYMDYLLTSDTEVYCPDRKKAVEIARESDHPAALTGSLNQYAFCFNNGFDQFEAGLAVLKEAADVAKANGLSADQSALIHNATGLLYRRNNLHEKAYEYLQKAYDGWASVDDTQDMFNMQHSLVGEAIALQKWGVAQNHVDHLFQLAKNHTDFEDFTFFAHYNQGRMAFEQRQFDEATDAMQAALAIKDTTNEQHFINLASAILTVAKHRSGQQAPLAHLDGSEYTLLEAIEGVIKKEFETVILWEAGNKQQALDRLWQSKDDATNDKLAFMKNNTAAQSMTFNQEINAFQQQALKDQLAIKDLELKKEQGEEAQARLTRTLAVLATLLLLIITFFLYQSRKFYRTRSRTDFMTGLKNRRASFQEAEGMLKAVEKQGTSMGLVIFDIDDFKKVNDQFGHIVGDKVIKQVAKRAESLLDKGMVLGRIGGEEFLILVSHCESNQLERLIEAIRQSVADQPLLVKDQSISLSISLGMTLSRPNMGESIHALIKRADIALYQAKTAGKNQSLWFVDD